MRYKYAGDTMHHCVPSVLHLLLKRKGAFLMMPPFFNMPSRARRVGGGYRTTAVSTGGLIILRSAVISADEAEAPV